MLPNERKQQSIRKGSANAAQLLQLIATNLQCHQANEEKKDKDETNSPKDEVERFQNASSKLENFLSIIKRGDQLTTS